jgi:twitching motility protein PilT
MLQTRNIEELVGKMVALEGSDLHIKVGAPPSVRVHDRLEPSKATRFCVRPTRRG